MNWGRGLFRLWLLAVPFWGLVWAAHTGALFGGEVNWTAFWIVLVGAAIAALGLGYAIVWVIEGFSKNKPN